MSWPQNYLTNTAPEAHGLATLGWIALIVFSVVTVIVWALLAWALSRRRGTLAEHAPVTLDDGKSWVKIGGYAIPCVILLVIFILTIHTLRAYPMVHELTPGAGALIRITGHQWWFDAEYLGNRPDLNVKAPTEIHVPTGCAVDLELQTRDVIHSFWVPKLNGKVDLVPGQTNHIRLHVDKPGLYEGECGEYCGMQHAHMRIQVVAQSPDDFQAWLAAQRAPAVATTQPRAQRGSQVFQAAACPLCHTVRGTAARGQIGPDLTHVASRLRIAGGTLDNTATHLKTWVAHAQSVKPGSLMPDLPQIAGDDLNALVAYLQGLY
jgi:cytochrome c oxidase subunit 2